MESIVRWLQTHFVAQLYGVNGHHVVHRATVVFTFEPDFFSTLNMSNIVRKSIYLNSESARCKVVGDFLVLILKV